MKARQALAGLLLGALWGGSYLFLRLSAREFGPWGLAAGRATGAR